MFIAGLIRDAREGQPLAPKPLMALVSFIANFFDTLGVGSYATTTSMVRFFKLMPDEKIPGSLNVGYVLPTMIQAYVTIHGVSGLGVTVPPVEVDPLTLILADRGGHPRRVARRGRRRVVAPPQDSAWHGFVSRRRGDHHARAFDRLPLPRGWSHRPDGHQLAIGIVGLFGLGALMTLGIGLYAPCLILVTLLGMNDKSGYPIMMGACAFLMPVAVIRFIRAKAYYPPAMLSMALPGIIAVPLAFKWFQNLPMTWVKVVVIFVVAYASITMLMTAYREKGTAAAARPASLEGASA